MNNENEILGELGIRVVAEDEIEEVDGHQRIHNDIDGNELDGCSCKGCSCEIAKGTEYCDYCEEDYENTMDMGEGEDSE